MLWLTCLAAACSLLLLACSRQLLAANYRSQGGNHVYKVDKTTGAALTNRDIIEVRDRRNEAMSAAPSMLAPR